MNELDVNVEQSICEYLLKKYKEKLRKHNRDNDHTNTIKQKRRDHAQLRKELELRYKIIVTNMEYVPMMSCGTAIGNKRMDQEQDSSKNL